MRTPESYEKEEIDAYLTTINVYVCKPTTGGYGQSGHADRLFCYRGFFGAIEVKREGKEPTALQRRRIEEVQQAGGFATWGTASKVIAEIEQWRSRLPLPAAGPPKT